MAIEVATDAADFQDSKPACEGACIPGLTKSPPPNYVVLRAGSQTPELFRASNDDEAVARMQREVRSGQIQVVHLFKHMCSEVFMSHSETVTPEALKERLNVLPKELQ